MEGQGVRRASPADQTPPKKKRKAQPGMVVTGGVRSDVQKFQWRVENFAAIRHNKKILRAQHFTIDLGTSVDVPCKWKFSLASETELVSIPAVGAPPQTSGGAAVVPANPVIQQVEWLEIKRKLVQVPQETDEVCNSCSLKIKDKEKRAFFKLYGGVNHLKLNGYRTFKKVMKLTDNSAELPLVDGALVIDFTLTTYSGMPVRIEGSDSPTDGFIKQANEKLSGDLVQLLMDNPEESYSDMKIISKDGMVFNVHRNVLAARNAVFKAMFSSKLSEHQTGLIRVNDLSGLALENVLKYIYGGPGSFMEEWFHPDVIVEFTYAAGKYQLSEVIKYLDSTLGMRGRGENAGALLALAGKLNMKNAETELLHYLRNLALTAASYRACFF